MSMRSKDVEIYVIKLRRLDVRRCVMQQRIKKAVVIIILLGMAAAFSGCAVLTPPEDWSENDTKYEMVWQVLNVIDARQTSRIQGMPGLYEKDKFVLRNAEECLELSAAILMLCAMIELARSLRSPERS